MSDQEIAHAPFTSNTASDLIDRSLTITLDKIEKAETLKKEGNAFFKEMEHKSAIRSYHKALMYAKGALVDVNPPLPELSPVHKTEVSPQTEKNLKTLLASIHNNLAACLLQKSGQKDYSRVISYCDKCLELDSSNTKALYRKAVALIALSRYQEAKVVTNSALTLSEGKDKAINGLMEKIKIAEKEQERAFSDMFKNKNLL